MRFPENLQCLPIRTRGALRIEIVKPKTQCNYRVLWIPARAQFEGAWPG
jgi:hypothetical protein